MTITGRGEHDTETQAREIASLMSADGGIGYRACRDRVDAFAAAVRAEHGEQIAQRIEVAAPAEMTRADVLNPDITPAMAARTIALRDGYLRAARLAREAQS